MRKLIAGPTVFICDECVELCDDIVADPLPEQATSKFPISVNYGDSIGKFDLAFLPGLIETLERIQPEMSFAFGGAKRRSDGMYISLIVESAKVVEADKISETRENLADLASKLREATKRLMAETDRRKHVEKELEKLKVDIFPLVIRQLRDQGDIQLSGIYPMCVLAMDIEGFSQMESRLRQARLNMLRGLAEPILGQAGQMIMNTWGDAIIAGFEDVNLAVECACRFQRHLEVEALPARIALSFGEISVDRNQLIGRSDFDGDAIMWAARLEPLAGAGEVICDSSVRHHPTFLETRFSITERNAELKKPIQSVKAGEAIRIFVTRLKHN